MIKKTYEMAKGPLPLTWEEYEKLLTKEWNSILNSDYVDEKIVHKFFEDNPCMVPGAFGLIGKSGHAPFPAALISKPVLPGFTRNVPDFMWIATNSGSIEPILIEIESPSKRWFNKDGTPTKDFTKAQSQLTDWRVWFSEDLNKAEFKKYYRIPQPISRRPIEPLFLLIYGRRNEYEDNDFLSSKKNSTKREKEVLMSFDRLKPDRNCEDFICVTIKKYGYYAISIPPTFYITPIMASYLSDIKDKETIVENHRYMDKDRASFLKSRFPYWYEWSKKNPSYLAENDRE